MMRTFNTYILALLALFTWSSCEEDFFERFVPEILYYQYDKVDTADFNEITLEKGETRYTVKARVSAPNKLKSIEIYQDNKLIRTITDFSQETKETEYFMAEEIHGINGRVIITTVATDRNKKVTTKLFTIN